MYPSLREAVSSLTDAVERAYAGKPETAPGDYPYIAYPAERFLVLLARAHSVWQARRRTERAAKFLDVGCGIGTKVFLARTLLNREYREAQTFGLEKLTEYCTKARQLLCVHGETLNSVILEGDALRFRDYGKFDLIYFYCPIFDLARERVLERRIVRQARPGTIIFSPMHASLRASRALQRIDDEIFIKRNV